MRSAILRLINPRFSKIVSAILAEGSVVGGAWRRPGVP